jgi:hypothetical protein
MTGPGSSQVQQAYQRTKTTQGTKGGLAQRLKLPPQPQATVQGVARVGSTQARTLAMNLAPMADGVLAGWFHGT